ncbi:MAG: M42 family metallopeptidase [Simkaniaceae bacterium]
MFKKLLLHLFVLSTVVFAHENDPTLELIRMLTNAHGGSGFEGPVRNIMKEQLSDLLVGLKVDKMGNLIGFRETGTGKPRVLLMAHMDEVAFIVREISEEGFIYFDSIGWWIDPVIVGQKWVISTPKGLVTGITGIESSHITIGYPKIPEVSQKRMFLDIGVSSKQEAEDLGIRPGLSITPDVDFQVLNGTNRYCAKAFDDRIALAAIITTLQKLKDVDLSCEVMVAATVQEEFVMKGAQAVFASTQPDVVVNLEVGIAKDFPLHFPNYLSHYPSLSRGPTIFVYDNSMLPTNGLVEYFTELAHTYEIPFQYEAELINYGQDGCRLQGSGCGTYVINLGIPTRYVHSHYGILDRSDFENMVLLLERFLTTFDQEALENLAL